MLTKAELTLTSRRHQFVSRILNNRPTDVTLSLNFLASNLRLTLVVWLLLLDAKELVFHHPRPNKHNLSQSLEVLNKHKLIR